MDPLEQLLRPVARVLNRNIGETKRARELCADLAGTLAAIRLRDTGLAMVFTIREDGIDLSRLTDEEPDIVITGSLSTLARVVAGGGEEDLLRDGSLELTGNPYKAQAFQRLLASARPDLEEELSRVVGDTAARGLGEFARSFARWARDARATMEQNLAEYLQEESREVPAPYEVERFAEEVGRLRDDVDRLAARLDRLLASRRA